MQKAKTAILAVTVLAAIGCAPAQARASDRNCFSQRTDSGTLKICANDSGGYEFGIKKFGDESEERDYDLDDREYSRHVHHAYYYPVVYEPVVVTHAYFVPPGHRKHHRHEHHRCEH